MRVTSTTKAIPVGIDKIEMTVPVERAVPPQRRGGIKTRMTEVDGERRLSVWWNPSRVLMPASSWLCPVDALDEALEALIGQMVHGRMFSVEDLKEATVGRLDVARDFEDVRHLPQMIDAFRRRPVARGAKAEAFDNGGSGLTQNGYRVGSDCRVMLYDKHLRRPRYAAPGEVRFEVRARRRWLSPEGIIRVGDISRERAERLLVGKWTDAGFGEPVIREEDFIERVLTTREWSTRVRGRFLLDSMQELRGGLGGSRQHLREFRARQRQIGLRGPELDVRSVRLDLELGTEVVES